MEGRVLILLETILIAKIYMFLKAFYIFSDQKSVKSLIEKW